VRPGARLGATARLASRSIGSIVRLADAVFHDA
jgi:hypothetical protein